MTDICRFRTFQLHWYAWRCEWLQELTQWDDRHGNIHQLLHHEPCSLWSAPNGRMPSKHIRELTLSNQLLEAAPRGQKTVAKRPKDWPWWRNLLDRNHKDPAHLRQFKVLDIPLNKKAALTSVYWKWLIINKSLFEQIFQLCSINFVVLFSKF